MLTTPIRHTRLNTLEEVKNFSFRTVSNATPLTKWQNNGHIAFADEYGTTVYVTPYRTEIHSILEEAGYKEECIFVPFSNGEERPEAYQWLEKIAEEERWAYTHAEAFKVATEKGIKPVKLSKKLQVQVKEISYYDDKENHTIYKELVSKYLFNNSKDNIGTYIVLDEKQLVVCDEYGRTFLLKAKTVINDIVNALIEAGYTRTIHPEWYIYRYEPVESENSLSPNVLE